MPQSGSTLSRLQGRLLFEYHRRALAKEARRSKRGRPVALRSEGGLVRVDDGTRQIHLPHVRRAHDFANGINSRLESVADKYIGETGLVPRAGDIVVDIGAGIGEFTLWCAALGAKVVAFEPDPVAFACLEKNAASASGVELHRHALWKERANLRLHGSLDTSESSLIEDGKANSRYTDVEAWPLDQLPFMVRLQVIDLLKIDGEGVEPEIISGAPRTLRRTRVVAVDVGATDRRPNLRSRVEAALDALNFRIIPNERSETLLALNASMVGPISTRVLGRRDS